VRPLAGVSSDAVAELPALETGPYRPGDEAAILECMRVCFRFEPDIGRWRHLTFDNPGGDPILLLARSGETVVAYQATIPRRFLAFGQRGLVGQCVDFMTRRDAWRRLDLMTRCEWRKKGLQTLLSDELYRIGKESRFLAGFGFANEQLLPGARVHQNRGVLEPFPVMVRPLRPVRAALLLTSQWLQRALRPKAKEPEIPDCAAAGPVPDYSEVSCEAAHQPHGSSKPGFDERHTDLFQAAEGLPPIAGMRDAAHLNWRYTDAPGSPYRQCDVLDGDVLQATIVFRTATLFNLRFVLVMEWFWRAGAVHHALNLVRRVVEYGQSVRAHGVAALAMPATPQRRLLHRMGFVGIPRAMQPKTARLVVAPLMDGPERQRWFKPENWYLTWGDGFIL